LKLNDLIKRLLRKQTGLDLNNPEHLQLVKKVHGSYYAFKNIYNKMYSYYKGDTDAIKKYLFVTERSNLKINANFIKKFIKEEVAYTLGNDITYESRTDNEAIVSDIEYYTAHWNELHDTDLMKYLLIFTRIYELYYIDDNADFCSKIIKPTDGYAYKEKSSGEVLFFIHEFKNDFDNTTSYIDVYTNDKIYHYDNKFNEIAIPTNNIFGEVPVTVGELTEEKADDSLFKDIRGLQDAFETNLSDVGNEISDFRNAYLVFKNAQVDDDKIPKMKELGVIQFPNSTNGDAVWLIKNINDTFIQNTLDRYEDTMYQLACLTNHNLNLKKNKNYDYKEVKALYTPNIPSDDLATAQMLAQIPDDTISKDTGRGLFSFVNNKVVEGEKVKKEKQDDLPEVDLDNLGDE